MSTKIEWTDRTFSPTTGCTQISPGCENCYAKTLSKRLAAMGQTDYDPGFALRVHEHRLHSDQHPPHPFNFKKPRMFFVDSMSDLFHKDVPVDFIQRVFAIATDPRGAHHTYQFLTKRATRVQRLASKLPWPPNVWMGVSVESAAQLWRADCLRQVPAAVRFLSLEPLLGPLDSLDLAGIGWVIVGGESGREARPMHPQWARDVRDKCQATGVPFHFKQWGSWAPEGAGKHACLLKADGSQITAESDYFSTPSEDIAYMVLTGNKKSSGRLLDGRTWDEMPAQGVDCR